MHFHLFQRNKNCFFFNLYTVAVKKIKLPTGKESVCVQENLFYSILEKLLFFDNFYKISPDIVFVYSPKVCISSYQYKVERPTKIYCSSSPMHNWHLQHLKLKIYVHKNILLTCVKHLHTD